MNAATCNACGADIVWAVTVNKRPIPLDAQPVEGGNIRLTGTTVTAYNKRRGPECEVVVQAGLLDEVEPRYISHFATCPHADELRKRA